MKSQGKEADGRPACGSSARPVSESLKHRLDARGPGVLSPEAAEPVAKKRVLSLGERLFERLRDLARARHGVYLGEGLAFRHPGRDDGLAGREELVELEGG